MPKQIIEYVWLDNNSGAEGKMLRSKTKVVNGTFEEYFEKAIELYPIWNYDGSSTGQAETHNSELLLKPVAKYRDPFRRAQNGIVVLCEVYDKESPHTSNTRNKLKAAATLYDSMHLTRYGFEQEYIMLNEDGTQPYGHLKLDQIEQGPYYCGNGHGRVAGRQLVEDHLEHCLYMGLNISGTNAEVMLSQWEYQLGPVSPLSGADDLWISRWVLYRLSEKSGITISLNPKPFVGTKYNGSGMHVNFSTPEMQLNGVDSKVEHVEKAIERLRVNHKIHIDVYGADNHLRLTGENETCDIETFKSGVGDRTASIRIPRGAFEHVANTYIEDRRPASNADPYEIVWALITTILA